MRICSQELIPLPNKFLIERAISINSNFEFLGKNKELFYHASVNHPLTRIASMMRETPTLKAASR